MFQWTEKLQSQQDWITILIVLIFGLSMYLYNRNPHQFKLLVSFWKSKIYFNIYDKEKYANPLHLFNLILTFITLITFSLLSYFFYKKILFSLLGGISFLSFFSVISVMVVLRFGILKLIFQLSNHLEFYKQTVFRSISFYAMISLYAIFIFSVYHFGFPNNTNLLLILILMVLCFVFLTQLTVYLRIIRFNPIRIVYLILYLCTFKIAPWLWLYKSIY
ncbi:MAG: DUF4271 domain-containing protein [Flavobacteriaceae bacterium]|nr:DUF4271 domain-containing protein [Flavobacteriaceae bacterium]